jgi:ABC-type bacteriocin/lantibiotic exporter with double-glycine peptidase domain
MTLGTFASFLALQGMFMAPLESLLGTVSQLQYLGNHLERLDDVLTTTPEPSGSADPGQLRGAVELSDVSFGFSPTEPPTLKNVSVRICAGEKVAIVGPSGAGKSTLARLLLGMHLPSSGTISFDGQDLRDLDLQRVRDQMGVVLQETFLFDDTVRANLGLKDEEIPLDRLRAAAKVACVDHVIDAMPDGFNSRLGDNGNVLSGGQRQRLNWRGRSSGSRHAPARRGDQRPRPRDRRRGSREPGRPRLHTHPHRASPRHGQDADRILVLEAGRIVRRARTRLSARDGLFRSLVQAKEFAANA